MAKHAPGSFSKNFAWHGTGLRKLHIVIRAGFRDALAPVRRDRFREDSGLDASLSLIPVNFFLHNRSGSMSVDELVFQAIERPHSIRFDRLALYALHLNRVGTGTRVVSRPAMWANEFVRERLWQSGAWRSSALPDDSLDPFIEDRMDAQLDVRVKCRNNYRHLYELCEFWPKSLPVINAQAEQWIASALFLAWDRLILEGGPSDRASLVDLIDSDELYKLLGVTRGFALAQAGDLADLYGSVGGIERFREAKTAPAPTTPPPPKPAPEIPEEEGLEWLEQEESDEVVERRAVELQKQKRNRKKAAALKQHYDNTCQFCGTKLQISEDRNYSEAAHIKGLGEPHNGPDKSSNMLVLCPNHHLQFDRGILRIANVRGGYVIRSKARDDPLNGQKIILTHTLDDACVNYQYRWFGSKR
jgi:hypothetical protein